MIKIGLVGLGHGKTLLQINTPDVYRTCIFYREALHVN